MLKCRSAAIVLFVASSASHANNCDSIRAQVDAKVRASGVTNFILSVVEAEAKVSGKVVGSCDLGTKKIVYNQSSSPAPSQPQAKPSEEGILTECKDGSVAIGGNCKK